jgi:hypothetical protein
LRRLLSPWNVNPSPHTAALKTLDVDGRPADFKNSAPARRGESCEEKGPIDVRLASVSGKHFLRRTSCQHQ